MRINSLHGVDRPLLNWFRNLVFVLIAGAMLWPRAARAQDPQVLLTNFPGAMTYNGLGGVLGDSHGNAATTGMNAFSILVGPAPITVTSLEVYIRGRDTLPDTVIGGIYSDNQNQVGTQLVSFGNVTIPGDAPAIGKATAAQLYVLTIANAKGAYVLDANTRYWFELSGTVYTNTAPVGQNSTPVWSSTVPPAAPAVPTTLGAALTFGEFRITTNNGETWPVAAHIGAFQVKGLATPVAGAPVPAVATVPPAAVGEPSLVLSKRLIGHSEYVNSVAFSPDGKSIASGGRDKTVRLWDVATCEQKALLWKHTAFVGAVAFSPDGHSLASGGWDNKIRLFDLGSGDEISEGKFDKNTSAVLSLAFSVNGRRLASGSNDRTARNFSASTGIAETVTPLPDAVATVAYSPDGSRIAGACLDGSLYIWDAGTMHLVKKITPNGTPESFFSVVFLDNDLIAAAGKSGVADVWHLPDAEPVATLSVGQTTIYGLAYSARKHLLAAGGTDKVIRLWTLDTIRKAKGGLAEPAYTAPGHTDTVRTLAFSPNGDLLASGGWDYNIIMWRVRGGTP